MKQWIIEKTLQTNYKAYTSLRVGPIVPVVDMQIWSVFLITLVPTGHWSGSTREENYRTQTAQRFSTRYWAHSLSLPDKGLARDP